MYADGSPLPLTLRVLAISALKFLCKMEGLNFYPLKIEHAGRIAVSNPQSEIPNPKLSDSVKSPMLILANEKV